MIKQQQLATSKAQEKGKKTSVKLKAIVFTTLTNTMELKLGRNLDLDFFVESY